MAGSPAAATTVHGAAKLLMFATGIGDRVLVDDDALELRTVRRRIRLPKGSPGLRLTDDGFEAEVADVGPVAFSAWRGSRWRSALRDHGWQVSPAAAP